MPAGAGVDDLLTLAALGLLALVSALAALGHIVLSKSDVRAAIGWSGVVLIVPVLGPLAYLLFGINRVKRRAATIFGPSRARSRTRWAIPREDQAPRSPLTHGKEGMRRFVDGLVLDRLRPGNSVEPLVSGAQAYDAMLAAIERAESTVALATYIFDHDPTGLELAQSLVRATQRGAQVRVLIDAVGDRYSFPSMVSYLRRHGVRAAPFNRNRVPWRFPYFNLRNHRKLLVVDGSLAFTGGMNIRQGHRLDPHQPGAIQDLHFCVKGPVVEDLLSVFAGDWLFATGETLEADLWFRRLDEGGSVFARVVEDGPDRNLDKLLWAVMGALACAERRIRIVTPYFLPDTGLDRALQVAARRGVEVDIVLPERGNLQLVQCASRAGWRWILEGGCRLFLSPPPFDHTKLLLMDDDWSFVGSANLDPRSLRLNFELNLECHDRELNRRLDAIFEEKKRLARELDLDDWWSQPLRRRLLDGAARLLSPYL